MTAAIAAATQTSQGIDLNMVPRLVGHRRRTFGDWTVAVKPLTGYPDRAIAQTQRGLVMRAFVFACIGAIAIALIGAVVLGSIQESADQAFSTSAVRLGQ
jgi:hypothetical protein